MAKSKSERDDDKRIMTLFRRRCVVCMQPATEVNEIILRSRTKAAVLLPANRVPMCHKCHHVYHWSGVTDDKQERLRALAIQRLTAFGEGVEKW